MPLYNIDEIVIAIEIGVFSYIFCCVLISQDYILEFWYDLIVGLPRWLMYPLGYCEICFAGQVSLWLWLVYNWQLYASQPLEAFIRHIAFMSIAMLITKLLKKLCRID